MTSNFRQATLQKFREIYDEPRNVTFLDNIESKLTAFKLLRNSEVYICNMYEDLLADADRTDRNEFSLYEIIYIASLYYLNEYALRNGMSHRKSSEYIPAPFIEHCNNPRIDTKRVLNNFYNNQIAYINNLARQAPLQQEWLTRKQYFGFILSTL